MKSLTGYCRDLPTTDLAQFTHGESIRSSPKDQAPNWALLHRLLPGSGPGPLQHPLAAGHRAGAARIDLHRQPQGAGKGLEAGLDDVVGIDAIELADVQGEATVVDDRHKKLLHQLGVVAADPLGRNHQAIGEVGPAGAIKGHLHQGLIKGRHEMAEAMDAAAVAQGLGQGLADGDAHVLVAVVVIDMGVARGADLQVEQPMAGELVQHVIQKGHASSHLAAAAAIEVERHPHIGFTGDTVNLSGAIRNTHDGRGNRRWWESWRMGDQKRQASQSAERHRLNPQAEDPSTLNQSLLNQFLLCPAAMAGHLAGVTALGQELHSLPKYNRNRSKRLENQGRNQGPSPWTARPRQRQILGPAASVPRFSEKTQDQQL